MITQRRRTYKCLLCGKVYLHKKTITKHWENHYNTKDKYFTKWLTTPKGKAWLKKQ